MARVRILWLMATLANRLCRSIVNSLPRLWWGLLLLIHMPILAAAASSIILGGPDPSRIGNLIALVVATAFFTLKLQDVAFLRLRTRRHSFVVVCLLTALVHHGAVAPGPHSALIVQSTAVAMTTGAAHLWLRRRPELARGWASRLAALLAVPYVIPTVAGGCDWRCQSPPRRVTSSPPFRALHRCESRWQDVDRAPSASRSAVLPCAAPRNEATRP